MIEQAARGAIWGVHGAQEAPSLWHQLAHSCSTQLGKVCPSVDGPEMGQVSADSTLLLDISSDDWYGLMQSLSLKDSWTNRRLWLRGVAWAGCMDTAHDGSSLWYTWVKEVKQSWCTRL